MPRHGSPEQQFLQASGPARVGGIDDLLQVAHQVAVARGMVALGVPEVRDPVVMYRDGSRFLLLAARAVPEAGDDIALLQCFLSSFRMAFPDHQLPAEQT